MIVMKIERSPWPTLLNGNVHQRRDTMVPLSADHTNCHMGTYSSGAKTPRSSTWKAELANQLAGPRTTGWKYKVS
jgi:hypothetical protein